MQEKTNPVTEKTEDEPSGDTQTEGEETGQKAAVSTFFGGLNAVIEKH